MSVEKQNQGFIRPLELQSFRVGLMLSGAIPGYNSSHYLSRAVIIEMKSLVFHVHLPVLEESLDIV
jgi:hypothetical protein